jgi:hydroxysqualene synthase
MRAVNAPTCPDEHPAVPPSSAPQAAAPVTHYENFPVASWLCPPRLRPAIAAIYGFARTADDIADEGDAPAGLRLQDLAAYRADLQATAAGQPPSNRWPQVFGPLGAAIAHWQLPVPLLDDLLRAFEQDIAKTRDGAGYADRAALLDYCSRSANPIGRLLLHLYGVHDAAALAQSDAICSALQLINFWQDLSVDIPRRRYYLPHDRSAALGVDPGALNQTPQATALIAEQVRWARALMLQGAPLVHQVPGRAGWELRLVVQGGLRILDRIAALDHATLRTRPTLRKTDLAVMLWRGLWM